ncbi:MAG: hypothetical protein AAFW75_28225 [Cyanobacteria bacterium J06636_16]
MRRSHVLQSTLRSAANALIRANEPGLKLPGPIALVLSGWRPPAVAVRTLRSALGALKKVSERRSDYEPESFFRGLIKNAIGADAERHNRRITATATAIS